MKEYYNPVELIFGKGTLEKVSELAEKYSNSRKVLIVTGKNSMRRQGITQKIEKMLQDHSYEVDTFERVGSNPTIDIIDEGADLLRAEDYGLVLGLGGGSAMDCAKCMAILAKNEGRVMEYLKKEKTLENDGIPLLEIPSTAGTGSEVTKWATVWDMRQDSKKKYSLADEKMYAKAAIVDAELTLGLSPRMTAITGMDALCQAIEAYWSRNHNPVSDIHALKAIKLLTQNLEKAFSFPDNIEYRENVALGSLESGLAFSNTKTTAVHSTSYPMTAHFGVPHGLACALTLGAFLIYNSAVGDDNIPEAPGRIKDISEAMGCNDADSAARRITDMMKDMGLPVTLSEAGMDQSAIDLIVKEGFTPDRVKHNPRIVTAESLRKLLLSIVD